MFILIFMILWLNKKYKNRICVIQAIIACCFAFVFNRIIGLFFYRERPFVSHLNINQLVEHTANASFPSDHATSAFVIAITLCLYEKRLGKVFFIVSFFNCFFKGLGRSTLSARCINRSCFRTFVGLYNPLYS